MSTLPDTPPPPRRRDTWLRLGLVLIVVVAFFTFYATGLHESLRWDTVRAQIGAWKQMADDQILLGIFVFFGIYVLATALSLPVAFILSLVAGALFGRWQGPLIVSLASTCGACLALLGSRYLFRDWVRRTFGTRLRGLDLGIERDGAWYLLTLRLLPVVPFFLINLGMGLTPIRLGTFALVSWLGMLPASFVICNAGTALIGLEKPSDALSPTFLGSLTLLGVFPLLVRWFLRSWQTPSCRSDPSSRQ